MESADFCRSDKRKIRKTARRSFGLAEFVKRLNRKRKSKDYRTVASSGYFDEAWYRAHYSDILDDDPVRDYLRRAIETRRDPGPRFSTSKYLVRHPELVRSDLNPLLHFLRNEKKNSRARIQPPARSVEKIANTRKPRGQLVVGCIAGERASGRPYRVDRFADAIRHCGHEAFVIDVFEIAKEHEKLRECDVLFIWRARWSPDIEYAIKCARDGGARVIFDCDDLVICPQYATSKIIDGIRSNGHDEDNIRELYKAYRTTLLHCDFGLCTTETLAREMRSLGKPAMILPNGFDDTVFEISREAARAKCRSEGDGLIRIGYAGGSKTHQRDFAQAASAIAEVLRRHKNTRLVLYQRPDGVPLMDTDEFPEFVGLENQIEWRTHVHWRDLPKEMARYDISLAPLEFGNVFCESKSNLKFFEAALAGVPTIASPAEPFASVIKNGENGFLASAHGQWVEALEKLIAEPQLRSRLAKKARDFSLWHYSPRRRAQLVANILDQVVGGPRTAAAGFELANYRAQRLTPEIEIPSSKVVFERDAGAVAKVTVLIPLYNYAHYIQEALASVAAQTMRVLDLVVVDDRSTDESLSIVLRWLDGNANRFNRVVVVQCDVNSGLGAARNIGFDISDSKYVMTLDADNTLEPECCEDLFKAIEQEHSAFAYSHLQQFGIASAKMGVAPFHAQRFVLGNYIDAMALIAKHAWLAVGGYMTARKGWQDYDLWCRFIDVGFWGTQVPRVLANYRVHGASMRQTRTDRYENRVELAATMNADHSWLRVRLPTPTA